MDTALPNEAISREPFPGSRKVYAEGSDPSIRVPFRAIALTNGEAHAVYDTSGPFTDPDVAIDVRAGIAPLRQAGSKRATTPSNWRSRPPCTASAANRCAELDGIRFKSQRPARAARSRART